MPPEIQRVDPSLISDERTSLNEWLDFHRNTLLQKCDGLSGAQLAQASLPPSNLTLLGLVQHMALVEWWWFQEIFLANGTVEPFDTHNDPEYEFTHVDPARAEAMLDLFRRQCEEARQVVAVASGLDELSKGTKRETRDLRWILIHMIEEYARHNGHADLLREAIDGVVGD
jgi:hypothetical protein